MSIRGGNVLVGNSIVAGTVTCSGGTIQSVEPTTAAPLGSPDIDANGLIVSPGFVDLQVNGGFGFDLLDDATGMWPLAERLLATGVTAFLPTIVSSGPQARSNGLDALRERPQLHAGAVPLGLHFEGPMLNTARRGAHSADDLVAPSRSVIDGWSRDNGVCMVTLAPELPGAEGVIRELVDRGVVVALGHSEATSADAQAACSAGARAVTHLFNAMAPLGHRQPNLVGFALGKPDLVAGIIVDGVHVDPLAVSLAWKAKGPAGIVLVTDAVAAMGQPPGRYRLAGRQITADRSGVRNSEGTLAGSALTMDQAVRNIVRFAHCAPSDALISATRTPADLIGDEQRGRIEPGANADLVLLDDQLVVQVTICGGQIGYIADGSHDRVAAHLIEEGKQWRSS